MRKKQKRVWFEDIRKHRTYYIMLIPVIAFFVAFSYLPMVGIYNAFTRYDFSLGMLKSPFIGLKNFEFLFQGGTDSILWRLTKNTVLYSLAFIIVGNICQIGAAILLKELTDKWKRFSKTCQTMMMMPYFVSMVMVGTIVYNILNYRYGIINHVLTNLGLEKIDFYRTTWVWPIILVLVNTWKGLGYGSVIYLASILGIDESIYEAAYVDGASRVMRIRKITLPLLKPTIVILLLMALGGILKGQFDLFWNVVGDNGMLLNVTDVIDTYVYRSLTVSFDIGRGAAAGLYQSVFGFVLTVAVNSIVKKISPDNALF